MRLLLQEAVAAAELCACCFELIIGIKTFRHSRCFIRNCRSWFMNEVSSDTSYFQHVLLYRKLTFNVPNPHIGTLKGTVVVIKVHIYVRSCI
jgi:hypothetical protein